MYHMVLFRMDSIYRFHLYLNQTASVVADSVARQKDSSTVYIDETKAKNIISKLQDNVILRLSKINHVDFETIMIR